MDYPKVTFVVGTPIVFPELVDVLMKVCYKEKITKLLKWRARISFKGVPYVLMLLKIHKDDYKKNYQVLANPCTSDVQENLHVGSARIGDGNHIKDFFNYDILINNLVEVAHGMFPCSRGGIMGGNLEPFFELKVRYRDYLEEGQWLSYIRDLSEEALQWWFHMDTLTILSHLAPIEEFPVDASIELPLRIRFLAEAAKTSIPYEKMCEFYDAFVAEGDLEGASAAAGAAVASVWDSGHSFQRYEIWLDRIESLLSYKDRLSTLAQASLIGFKGLMYLTAWDIEEAYRTYATMRPLAEEAGSYPLMLYYASARTYCLVWMGRLSEAEVLIKDMQVLCDMPGVHIVARAYFEASRGLFLYVKGQTEEAEGVLKSIVELPMFEYMPPPVYFLVYGHLLLTVALRADEEPVEAVAQKLRQKVIPEMNYFHGSYMHYNLATAYMMAGNPHRALLHAREAMQRAQSSNSKVAQMIPPLAFGQALVDNNELDEAIEFLRKWCSLWKESHFSLLACSGWLELAWCYLQKGMVKEARESFENALSVVPSGEEMVYLNRPRFIEKIKTALFPSEMSNKPMLEIHNMPVCITTFGDFQIRIGDVLIYDRKWRGGRTKALLKALIVFGGSKVSYELLMDTLWPETDGDVAENNLKVALSRLRRIGCKRGQHPIKWILVNQRKVSLARPVCGVDSIVFKESLENFFRSGGNISLLIDTLNLYKDDFLAKDQSETWIIRHREVLKEDYVQAVLLLSEMCKKEKHPKEALPYLYRACEKDPLNEEIYAMMMDLYMTCGYPSRAIQIYKMAEETLKKELEISPGPRLQELARMAGLKI